MTFITTLSSNDIKFVSLTFTVEKDGKMEDHLDNFTNYQEYVDFYNELREGAFFAHFHAQL